MWDKSANVMLCLFWAQAEPTTFYADDSWDNFGIAWQDLTGPGSTWMLMLNMLRQTCQIHGSGRMITVE